MSEPTRVVAGDTVRWRRTFTDYPPADWTVTYVIPGLGSFAATEEGDEYVIEILAATTAAWAAGPYQWFARATQGTEVATVASGWLDVEPNPATATSPAGELVELRTAVAAIDALLQGKATADQRRYRIKDRELERYGIEELMMLANHFRSRLQRLEQQLGVATRSSKVVTRFVPAR